MSNINFYESKDISIKSLESILNSIDAMIYVTVPDTGEILFVNKQLKSFFGQKDDNFNGQFCYKLFRGFDKMCGFCPCFHLDNDPDHIFMWDEYVEKYKLHIRHSDFLIDWPNGEKVHLQHAVDITELTNAREQAEQSSKSKSIFLSHMSHEIRTPMNAILGIAEIQLQKENLQPDTCEAFGKIYESGDLLLNIINDLLDLSKIESGKLEIFPVNYEIPSLINDTTQLNRLRYESKPIEFSILLDKKTPIKLFGDVLRIKQILNNILSNAFKYTDEGKIEFSIHCENMKDPEDIMLVFRISDTGQGMTVDQIPKLFEEYTRFNLEKNQTTVGAGLGMSITKRLIDLMDGQIIVESKIDKGSTFTARIPQKRAGIEVCGDLLINKLKNFTFHSTSIMKKVQFLREYMPYGRVLVVDDVESNIYVAKGMLIPYGLKIDTSFSGFEAIEKIRNGNVYDIIFMDHMMPKMDGIEAVKIIRKMGYTNTIIALTANAILGRAKMFLQNGFDSFLSKPIDSRELDYLLNNFIKNRKPQEIVEAARNVSVEDRILNNNKNNQINETILENIFVKDAQKAVNILEKIKINDSEIETYITTVHGMKSALANIGENDLSAIALKMENAGKRWDFDMLLNETSAFINALKSLILKYKTVEETENGEIPSEDLVYLQNKLADIRTACLLLDKRSAKKVINELKNTVWPRRIKSVVDELFMHLLHSDFKEMVKLVDEFGK
ncbi:MAG: ATP-binding protein [Treponema sp.]|nr:ATP-binding protein [Treponema sp.]